MKKIILPFILLIVFSGTQCVVRADTFLSQDKFIRHNLKVVLYPREHRFTSEDTVTVPVHLLPEFRFSLHKGLEPFSPTQGVIIRRESGMRDGIFASFRVKLPRGVNTFLLKYGGIIRHPIEQYGKEQARGYRQTKGLISEEGVYLEGSSYWYPAFDEGMLTFRLRIELPAEWDGVSQGGRTFHLREKRVTHVQWESPEAQEEIFLVAAPFHEYDRSAGNTLAMVFLRESDRGLAEKYLDATVRYLAMYEKLIGPYPYKKFALVENFWETGFGMPSFTLLGPKVIRFPFILNTSYPHEILHNWWGNSVYPDYKAGNWSEGFTAYLSDHLLSEQQGEGSAYRLTTLQKYADYVSGGRDFPITEFLSRHSSSSEAIGYGKSLMFFHMLRLELGDAAFIGGIQDFYRKNKFRAASFTDLRKSFEYVSGKDLKVQFDRWITKPGAPELKVSDVEIEAEGYGYGLTAVIEQVQSGPGYHLRIPVAVTMKGHEQTYQTVVLMDKKCIKMRLMLPSKPVRIDIDPEFDLFRRLNRDEIPPAVSQALGAKSLLVVLPSSSSGRMLQAYQEFADSLRNSGPDHVEIKSDRELSNLPSDRAVCILGRENRFFRNGIAALSGYGKLMDMEKIQIGETEVPFEGHSLVLAGRSRENKNAAILLVASGSPGALPGLSRKLPHYHKYSYLVFKGDEPVNIAKGRWPVLDSPMTVYVPGENGISYRTEIGKLNRRKPLITMKTAFSSERMMETVRFLSGDELKGRALGTEGLDRAAEFIAEKFREAGLKPLGDPEGSYFQTWEAKDAENPGRKFIMKNVVGVIPGKNPEWSGQSVVVGAHYDHLGMRKSGGTEQVYHGTDDNASGVSVLIELARMFGKGPDPERSIVFAAFTGEENGRQGSKHYISQQKHYPVGQTIGMLNLDTIGRLGGRKLLVIGAGSAAEWEHIFRGAGYTAGIEVAAVSEELDSSDQQSFQEAGIPAVQLFTGPHPDYHRPTDTAEKLDSAGLAKIALVAKEVIQYLADRQQPLTNTIASVRKTESGPGKERRVSLGIIPDFAFHGDGSRVSGVIQGSPAEKAGIKEGDIIVRMNSAGIRNLKDLSDTLKNLHPGDDVSITMLRDGEEIRVETVVIGR